MVQPLRINYNKSPGTAVGDGFRIAPTFSTLPANVGSLGAPTSTNAIYYKYGPGMPLSPNYTYNIVPYPPTAGNVVAIGTTSTAGGWLTLAGDNGVTTLVPSDNNNAFPPGAPSASYLQLDWPRVIQVNITTANLGNPVSVTIFGEDWYSQPMQHTYTNIQNIGVYPRALYNTDTNLGTTSVKAFYKIRGVFLNGITTTTATISLQTTNIFGLPYVLDSYGDIQAFSWNGQDMRVQGGTLLINSLFNTPVVAAMLNARTAAGGAGNVPPFSLSNLSITNQQATLAMSSLTASRFASPGGFIVLAGNVVTTAPDFASWMVPNGGQWITAPADRTNPATATSGDPRGLVQLPNAASPGQIIEEWQTPSTGIQRLVFSYYLQGYDQWLNFLNSSGQAQQNGTPTLDPVTGNPVPGTNPIVPANTVLDMYGVPQYYTGQRG